MKKPSERIEQRIDEIMEELRIKAQAEGGVIQPIIVLKLALYDYLDEQYENNTSQSDKD